LFCPQVGDASMSPGFVDLKGISVMTSFRVLADFLDRRFRAHDKRLPRQFVRRSILRVRDVRPRRKSGQQSS